MPRVDKQKKSEKQNYPIIKKVTTEKKLSILTIILFFIFVVLFIIVFDRILVRNNFEKDVLTVSNNNSSEIFSLDKIFLFSSANAIHNNEKQNFWDLNIYQYTDIAIYINNNSDDFITNKNTVKNLYIDNIHFSETSKGLKSLYYKDINTFGNSILNDSNLINDKLNFEVLDINSNLDYTKPQIYNTLDNPITLEFINKSFKESTIIPNNNQSLVFDGSLLKNLETPLSHLQETVSFTIHIINYLDEEFVCTVQIPISLEDDLQNITNGYIQKTIDNLSNYKFYRRY